MLRFFQGVERQCRSVLSGARLVVVGGVFFLQVARVGKQNAAQIDGRGRGVDRSVEALLHQARDPARVVEMSVGQDDGVNGARR